MQALTGQVPDISHFLHFSFWEPVYSKIDENEPDHRFPSQSNEKRGHCCRILGLTALNSLLQYVNWLVGRFVLSTEWSRTRRLDYSDLNWPRCSAWVTESLALTDGGFCQSKKLYILDNVNFVRL